MVKPALAWDTFLDLGGPGDGPLHVRLTRALRRAILDGAMPGGSTLPSSRQLARDLGCSRWVVTEAYALLAAEGYLEAKPGSATRVRRQPAEADEGELPPRRPVRLDLVPGLPDLRAFPRTRWQAALRDGLLDVSFPELGYPDPAGHPRLRQALAAHLRRTRAARTTTSTVLVTTGVVDGLMRVLRAFGDGRPRVAVEDPGWTRARQAIAETGAQVVPVPVDEHGLRVDALDAVAVDAVVVGAAHQFPSGVVLADERRGQLLAWARDGRRLVLEDDYDAEFRYDRPSAPALQSTAPEQVVLLGSVSKTLSPALGLGWLVVPSWLTATIGEQIHPRPSVPDQLALAHLLADGGYDRHLRKVRQAYRKRRAALLDELARQLPTAEVSGAAAGLHLLLRLPDGVAAAGVAARAARNGLRVAALDDYLVGGAPTQTLVLGYANLGDAVVAEAVGVLAEVVRDHQL